MSRKQKGILLMVGATLIMLIGIFFFFKGNEKVSSKDVNITEEVKKEAREADLEKSTEKNIDEEVETSDGHINIRYEFYPEIERKINFKVFKKEMNKFLNTIDFAGIDLIAKADTLTENFASKELSFVVTLNDPNNTAVFVTVLSDGTFTLEYR